MDRKILIEPRVHVPSVFFNRGDVNAGYNYGRLEHDALHHVSAAVQALASRHFSVSLCLEHLALARRVLDDLERLARSIPSALKEDDPR